jgi:LacI family transcriptional regulator
LDGLKPTVTRHLQNNHTRPATLADVGRAAGVSIVAVSTVLNHARTTSRVSEKTRKRILAAAAELRYRPNLAARSLANRRIHTLGVAAVVEGGELNHYFLEVFNGILAAAARHEQNTTVFTLHDWKSDHARLRDFCDGRIDGLILLAPTFGREAAPHLPAHTPFVSVHANHLFPGIVNIESDEEEGAFTLVRYLIAQGHRRVMHLTGPARLIGAERRIRGYKRALTAAGLRFDRDLLVPAGFTTEHGCVAMRGWLKQHAGEPLPHAVFCANDAAAFGCIEALAEAGLRVPDDISVAGFDDTLAARSVVPQLTSVRQPLREMGARAVELLLARVDHPVEMPAAIPEPVVFPVNLTPRASVAVRPTVKRLVSA